MKCSYCGCEIDELGRGKNEAQDIEGHGIVCCTDHGQQLLEQKGLVWGIDFYICEWCGKIFFHDPLGRQISPDTWESPGDVSEDDYCSGDCVIDHDEKLRSDWEDSYYDHIG